MKTVNFLKKLFSDHPQAAIIVPGYCLFTGGFFYKFYKQFNDPIGKGTLYKLKYAVIREEDVEDKSLLGTRYN
ncbi:hypothetical protein A3Q56_04497 [Intoshia linei]|uniref:Uncharacterized protein n=1 Tax=Intoshia linei TaxID=1819745 RepID=A0A177B2D1_9BILA|nr:hypothetical protein A3Q56_04497 [Intoshia linei]